VATGSLPHPCNGRAAPKLEMSKQNSKPHNIEAKIEGLQPGWRTNRMAIWHLLPSVVPSLWQIEVGWACGSQRSRSGRRGLTVSACVSAMLASAPCFLFSLCLCISCFGAGFDLEFYLVGDIDEREMREGRSARIEPDKRTFPTLLYSAWLVQACLRSLC
jgi:hypothetical protein